MRLIIQSKRIDAHTSRNVIGYVEGKDKNNFIVLTAHYDGIGQIGKYIFPCANRNAIGVATLLDLAAYFSKSENKPRYSILFIASSDGTNLAGFNYYVENPAVALDKMKLMINLEALGTGSQGLVVINGTKQKQMFQFLEKISNDEKYFHKILTKIGDDNDACAVFDKKNIPSISINSIGCEHNYINSTYDNYENLPFTKYESLFKLLRDFIVLYR
ncbi:hypothetical protein SDC9_176324 [bioreactor metagenome]|uniref:Peptidase M28 domain-containing protein n=1 Tax=bioreactor metagenome TaxID=1076179 RepID=A0A645GSU4_9ZZZZ